MKRALLILKFLVLIGLMVFLFSFSNKRNRARNLTKIEVEFVNDKSPFLTINTVNKLLIQNNVKVTGIGKEAIVLKDMERRLIENPMVREAQVYLTIDGVLGAKITQRNPVGRVVSSPDYYLDDEGKKMPLSSVFSARVPLINGVSEKHFSELTTLLLKINEDAFMKSSVVGLERTPTGNIILELRKQDFKVFFGRPTSIEKKFQNFKAFYKKTKQDSTLYGYQRVNLQFVSQVVATKKEGYGK